MQHIEWPQKHNNADTRDVDAHQHLACAKGRIQLKINFSPPMTFSRLKIKLTNSLQRFKIKNNISRANIVESE